MVEDERLDGEAMAEGLHRERISRLVKINAKPAPIEIDLARTAVIVVDMQNDFAHPDGTLFVGDSKGGAIHAIDVADRDRLHGGDQDLAGDARGVEREAVAGPPPPGVPPAQPPAQPPGGYGTGGVPQEHPKGTQILVLGILSLLCCGLLGPDVV